MTKIWLYVAPGAKPKIFQKKFCDSIPWGLPVGPTQINAHNCVVRTVAQFRKKHPKKPLWSSVWEAWAPCPALLKPPLNVFYITNAGKSGTPTHNNSQFFKILRNLRPFRYIFL